MECPEQRKREKPAGCLGGRAVFACPLEGTWELALSSSPTGASCGGLSLALQTHSDGLTGLQGTRPLEQGSGDSSRSQVPREPTYFFWLSGDLGSGWPRGRAW